MDHDHDHPRATAVMLLTVAVVLLMLIAFLIGVYLYFHHGGLSPMPDIRNVVNVKVNTKCPLQQQPLVIPPGNGKG
jgi:disulfide bond formation protein DsbB